MKKFLRVSFIPLLGCMLLIAAACGGNTSTQKEENYNQERMIAPDFDSGDSDYSELPKMPRYPDCSREPKISKLPFLKYFEDEDTREKVPVSYDGI